MSAVEAVCEKGEGEEGEEDKCLGLKEACEKNKGRREEERGQMCEVERVHARGMRGRGGRMSAVERVHVRRMEGTNLSTQSSSFLCVTWTGEPLNSELNIFPQLPLDVCRAPNNLNTTDIKTLIL